MESLHAICLLLRRSILRPFRAPRRGGWLPISANLIKASTGRMYFVPEGQHDRSQARSAWRHEENSPVPAGRLNGSWLRLDAFDRPSGTGSLHRYPGTSCLATISLSLRDKSNSPIEGPRIKLMLMGGRRTPQSRIDPFDA